ncbi:MAG: DUF362 domain-containing protein [Planctomycetes bacterium]|nr:DUF362 domain-containing protein [Planctomycetota bacterium]
MTKNISRRKFIRDSSLGVAGVLGVLQLPLNLLGQDKKNMPDTVEPTNDLRPKIKVIETISDQVWPNPDREPNTAIIKKFFEIGLKELTGQADLKTAWQSLVNSKDVVGIKVNPMGAMGRINCSTRPAVVNEVINGLKSAGVKENNIIIWDKMDMLLSQVGFKINKSKKGVRCFGSIPTAGFDNKITYHSKTDPDNVISKYSNILTKHVTKIINVPVLKDASVKGITGALVNVTFGGLDKVSRFHKFNCDPMIPEIYAHPVIKNKVVLHVLDALYGCFAGGPMPANPETLWRRNSLLFSYDPVALDRIQLDIIDKKRQEKKLPPTQPAAKHIFTAAKMGLGVADLSQINYSQKKL